MTLQLAEDCKKQILKLQNSEENGMQEEFILPDGSSFDLSDQVQMLNKYPFSDTKQGVSYS